MSWVLDRILRMTRARDEALTRVELARLEGSVSNLTQTLTAYQQSTAGQFETRDKVLADHESRIRTNERWRIALPPTLILAAVSIITNIITLAHH